MLGSIGAIYQEQTACSYCFLPEAVDDMLDPVRFTEAFVEELDRLCRISRPCHSFYDWRSRVSSSKVSRLRDP